MPGTLTNRARMAAAKIVRNLMFRAEGCFGVDYADRCDDCPAEPCKRLVLQAQETIHALLVDMRENWQFESIPTGRRVLIAAEYHDGTPNRVGIGEVYIEDGKKEIQVDDGIERLALELPLTVYAWQELPTPPPNFKKEAAPCQ